MAKTKNVKVRAKDLKAGKRIFISHPVHGIEEYLVMGRPYYRKWEHASGGTWWVMAYNIHSSLPFDKDSENAHLFYAKSLSDAGIPVGNGKHIDYNGRRTFFKRKHAEEWIKKWSTEPSYIKSNLLSDYYDDWDDYDDYDYWE